MQRSRLPLSGWHDVVYAPDGTISQVLTETIVTEALGQEDRIVGVSGRKDVLSGLKTAVLWSAAFWALMYAAVSLIF